MTKSSPAARQGAAPELPVDPAELAKLTAPERGRIYRKLELHPLQIASAEEAVTAVIRGRYRRAAR
ncbi:MAG: hypothetical protein AABM66_08200 [Actinomycetota bacterium]